MLRLSTNLKYSMTLRNRPNSMMNLSPVADTRIASRLSGLDLISVTRYLEHAIQFRIDLSIELLCLKAGNDLINVASQYCSARCLNASSRASRTISRRSVCIVSGSVEPPRVEFLIRKTDSDFCSDTMALRHNHVAQRRFSDSPGLRPPINLQRGRM